MKAIVSSELADKLYISDKVVSKWERALSMSDISLLMPLAKILDVSVTELLENTPEKKKARLKKTPPSSAAASC